MLPPFIIDEIRRREESEKRNPKHPFLELPLPSTPASPMPPKSDDQDRGVVIIDLGGTWGSTNDLL